MTQDQHFFNLLEAARKQREEQKALLKRVEETGEKEVTRLKDLLQAVTEDGKAQDKEEWNKIMDDLASQFPEARDLFQSNKR